MIRHMGKAGSNLDRNPTLETLRTVPCRGMDSGAIVKGKSILENGKTIKLMVTGSISPKSATIKVMFP